MANPEPVIKCDGCGKRDVPVVMRVVVAHPMAPVHTFCIACDPGGVNCTPPVRPISGPTE